MHTKIILVVLILIFGGVGGYYLVTKSRSEFSEIGQSQQKTVGEFTNTLNPNTDLTTTDKTKVTPITNKVDTKKVMSATLHTTKGDITIEFSSATPNTVANFVKLSQAGFYDGTKFHRVIKGFMNQGGDPLSKDDSQMASWGTGGPGYKFNDEITASNHNDVGTIAMANSGPNTNGSQFFINAAANNFLDTKHTVFGKVTAGLDVVMAINLVATGANDRPVEPVVIKSITLK